MFFSLGPWAPLRYLRETNGGSKSAMKRWPSALLSVVSPWSSWVINGHASQEPIKIGGTYDRKKAYDF